MMMDAIAQLAWNASTIALLPPNPILGMAIFKQDHPLKGKKSRVSRGPGGVPPIDQIRKLVSDGSPYPIVVLQKQDTETEMVTHKIRILK